MIPDTVTIAEIPLKVIVPSAIGAVPATVVMAGITKVPGVDRVILPPLILNAAELEFNAAGISAATSARAHTVFAVAAGGVSVNVLDPLDSVTVPVLVMVLLVLMIVAPLNPVLLLMSAVMLVWAAPPRCITHAVSVASSWANGTNGSTPVMLGNDDIANLLDTTRAKTAYYRTSVHARGRG